MTIKDLPIDQELRGVKIVIPPQFHHDAKMVGLSTMEVFIYSAWFHGVWVKTDLSSNRIYPLMINLSQMNDWVVVE